MRVVLCACMCGTLAHHRPIEAVVEAGVEAVVEVVAERSCAPAPSHLVSGWLDGAPDPVMLTR